MDCCSAEETDIDADSATERDFAAKEIESSGAETGIDAETGIVSETEMDCCSVVEIEVDSDSKTETSSSSGAEMKIESTATEMDSSFEIESAVTEIDASSGAETEIDSTATEIDSSSEIGAESTGLHSSGPNPIDV